METSHEGEFVAIDVLNGGCHLGETAEQALQNGTREIAERGIPPDTGWIPLGRSVQAMGGAMGPLSLSRYDQHGHACLKVHLCGVRHPRPGIEYDVMIDTGFSGFARRLSRVDGETVLPLDDHDSPRKPPTLVHARHPLARVLPAFGVAVDARDREGQIQQNRQRTAVSFQTPQRSTVRCRGFPTWRPMCSMSVSRSLTSQLCLGSFYPPTSGSSSYWKRPTGAWQEAKTSLGLLFVQTSPGGVSRGRLCGYRIG